MRQYFTQKAGQEVVFKWSERERRTRHYQQQGGASNNIMSTVFAIYNFTHNITLTSLVQLYCCNIYPFPTSISAAN
jgi:hypothetical protein